MLSIPDTITIKLDSNDLSNNLLLRNMLQDSSQRYTLSPTKAKDLSPDRCSVDSSE